MFAYKYVCMGGTQRTQKRELELESQMIASYYVGAGNQTWVLYKEQVFLTTHPPLQAHQYIFTETTLTKCVIFF